MNNKAVMTSVPLTHQNSFFSIAIINWLAVPVVAPEPAVHTQEAKYQCGNNNHRKVVNHHKPANIQWLSILHHSRSQNLKHEI